MQIIESSILGVRAAKLVLKSSQYQLKIILLPMIHMAEESYYIEVKNCLKECTFFLYEGVPGFRNTLITASYKLLKYRRDLGLAYQSDSLSTKEFGDKAIHADYNQNESDRNWKNLLFLQKLIFTVLVPCYGIYRFFTTTRKSLGKKLSTNDLKTRDEIFGFEDDDEIETYLFTARDKKLLAALSEQLKNNYKGTLGILYGAAHMSPVIYYLHNHHGFNVEKSTWLSVFKY